MSSFRGGMDGFGRGSNKKGLNLSVIRLEESGKYSICAYLKKLHHKKGFSN